MAQSETTKIGIWDRILSLVIGLSGAGMALPGAYLLSLGGSPYYLLAGIGLIVSAVFIWRKTNGGGLIYAAVFAVTLIWSVWESGLDGWALLPRLDLLTALGWLVLLTWAAKRSGRAAMGVVAGTFTIAAVCAAGGYLAWRGPAKTDQFAQAVQVSNGAGEWQFVGGDQGDLRYSTLGQITPSNVSGLKVAWTAHLELPPAGMAGAIEATPLKIGDMLYACNATNLVVALDAELGKVLWKADPRMGRAGVALATCRGLSYYRDSAADPASPCAERIVQTTYDAQLIELDRKTGQRCAGFGKDGVVDLMQGIGDSPKGYYYLTSPAAVVRDKLVVGSSVLDGQEVNEPSGVIRVFDARTGAFAWAWDMGRPGQHGMPPAGQTFTRGTPNAWAPITADDSTGLVFVPLGNATPDYVSAHRTEQMNRYASSLVALDADTGAVRWSFQTTHRDVWDYDVGSPPTLIDFPTRPVPRPAVVQATKRGQIFVLDRLTGAPLVKTVEKPVPQGWVPGQQLAPTQPYSVGMPSMGGPRLSEARMWGVTPFDQLWCRIRFKQARYDGDFTPVGSDRPTIVYPSDLGGSNWSGVAVDPKRDLLAVNVNYFAMYDRLVPRAEANKMGVAPFRAGHNELDFTLWPQGGTPYAASTSGFLSPIGVPCTQPPYGELAVINLKTRQVEWRNKIGTARDSGPFGIPLNLPIPMGSPQLGGSLMTQTGLLFIAATQDRTLRAFNSTNGKLLWQGRLPAGGHANPMSYYSTRSGRQFVVIAASGHPQLLDGQGDYLVAFALPLRKK